MDFLVGLLMLTVGLSLCFLYYKKQRAFFRFWFKIFSFNPWHNPNKQDRIAIYLDRASAGVMIIAGWCLIGTVTLVGLLVIGQGIDLWLR